MSELNQQHDNRAAIRWKLLTGVSALALTACVSGDPAKAEDTGKPLVWIELDGQFSKQDTGQEAFLPPFVAASQFDGASQITKTPQQIWDRGASLSYQPEGSDWILSASVRYGKVTKRLSENQLTANPTHYHLSYDAYQNWALASKESHIIADFHAGSDFGIGRFGSGGTSQWDIGVRYANFNSKTDINILSRPTNAGLTYIRHYASDVSTRKFSGIGPSLSWDASANIVGNSSSGSLSLDWGVNGAVLFGNQRTRGHHQITYEHVSHPSNHHHSSVPHQTSASPDRSRNVVVPNLGGFAGVSWRYPSAKVTIGYRADIFFGAIDGGIDVAHRENRGFYGPFASVSVGFP